MDTVSPYSCCYGLRVSIFLLLWTPCLHIPVAMATDSVSPYSCCSKFVIGFIDQSSHTVIFLFYVPVFENILVPIETRDSVLPLPVCT